MLKADLAWPAYGYGSEGQQVTAVAIDQKGTLHSLDRGGRSWEGRNADTVISQPVIRKWTATGELQDEQGEGIFVMPHSITPCEDGGIVVTDVGLHQVIKLDEKGSVEWTLGTSRKASDALDCFSLPTDVAIADDGSFYVSDGYGNARILKFTKDRKLDRTWGKKGTEECEFNLPHSLDLSAGGQLYVADRENERIQVFNGYGTFLSELKSHKIGKPFALCKKSELIYVADCGFPTDQRAAVVVIDLSKNSICRIGKFGSDAGDLMGPHGITVDAQGAVYVADAVLGLLKFKPKDDGNV